MLKVIRECCQSYRVAGAGPGQDLGLHMPVSPPVADTVDPLFHISAAEGDSSQHTMTFQLEHWVTLLMLSLELWEHA